MPYFAPRADAPLCEVKGVIVSVAKPFWLSIETPVTCGERYAVVGVITGPATDLTMGTSDVYVATL
jgi:hypothetical protein